jgi:hypothetical protein
MSTLSFFSAFGGAAAILSAFLAAAARFFWRFLTIKIVKLILHKIFNRLTYVHS